MTHAYIPGAAALVITLYSLNAFMAYAAITMHVEMGFLPPASSSSDSDSDSDSMPDPQTLGLHPDNRALHPDNLAAFRARKKMKAKCRGVDDEYVERVQKAKGVWGSEQGEWKGVMETDHEVCLLVC